MIEVFVEQSLNSIGSANELDAFISFYFLDTGHVFLPYVYASLTQW